MAALKFARGVNDLGQRARARSLEEGLQIQPAVEDFFLTLVSVSSSRSKR